MERQSRIPRKLKIIWVKLWQKTYPETVEINGVVLSVTPKIVNNLAINEFIVWDQTTNRFYGCIDYFNSLIPNSNHSQSNPRPGDKIRARVYTKPQFLSIQPSQLIKHPRSGNPLLVLFNETAEFSCSTN